MFIIGNTDTYRSIAMWNQVIEMLAQDGNLGLKIPLCCPRHPDTTIEVASAEDFVRLSPEGGCELPCGLRQECGHSCTYKCHSRPRHDASICQEPCPRMRDSCQHRCPLVCGKPCHICCQATVEDIVLPCGHKRTRVKCYEAQNTTRIICFERIQKQVPGCGHDVSIMCGKSTTSETFKCPATCGTLLPCGHACQKPCNSCRPKKQDVQAMLYHAICSTACGHPYINCNHECQARCHGNMPCPPCSQKCDIACGHSRCAKQCQEPCAPCAEICAVGCLHRGQCRLPCAVPCSILPCSLRCDRLLTCGY